MAGEIGVYEAKTRLTSLLDQVEHGEPRAGMEKYSI
jgi:antitoxin (DNA-binding transcriptional repressor) of toxin-antitoxin stability system